MRTLFVPTVTVQFALSLIRGPYVVEYTSQCSCQLIIIKSSSTARFSINNVSILIVTNPSRTNIRSFRLCYALVFSRIDFTAADMFVPVTYCAWTTFEIVIKTPHVDNISWATLHFRLVSVVALPPC